MADHENEAADTQPPPEQPDGESAVTIEEETTITTTGGETAITTTGEETTTAEAESTEQAVSESGEDGEGQATAEATEAPAEANSDADQKPSDAVSDVPTEVTSSEAVEAEPEQKGPEEETAQATEQKEEGEKTEGGEAETEVAEGGVPAEGEVKEEEKGEDKDEGEGGEGPVAGTEEAKEEEGGTKSPVPQSDTFTEGERPEIGGVQVGEALSREATPVLEEKVGEAPERLEAGTPENLAMKVQAQGEFHSNTKRSDMNQQAGRPKRFTPAYFYFYAYCQKEARKQFCSCSMTPVTEFTKLCASRWRTLSDSQKKPFEDMATQDKARYLEELAAYGGKKAAAKEEATNNGPNTTTSVEFNKDTPFVQGSDAGTFSDPCSNRSNKSPAEVIILNHPATTSKFHEGCPHGNSSKMSSYCQECEYIDAWPDKSKKPPTAFFIFLASFRMKMKETAMDSKDLVRLAGEEWRAMSCGQRQYFAECSAQARRLHMYMSGRTTCRKDCTDCCGEHDDDEDEEED